MQQERTRVTMTTLGLAYMVEVKEAEKGPSAPVASARNRESD